MSNPQISFDRVFSRRTAERGQTLVIALAVMFFLLVIGGLFVARIARNLVVAGNSRDSAEARQLAQAGLEYCNTMLNSSLEGADWRPDPTPPIGPTDPDYFWLVRGFSRIPMKGGRALVRVAYDPNPNNPLGQALTIESVGRPGELPNPPGSDPTVFVPNGNSPTLRSELVAYKEIGLTDYGLYITGKDRRTVPNYVGTPSIGAYPATVLGNPMLGFAPYANGAAQVGTQRFSIFGFPIYCNGDLTLGGDTYLYESHRGGNTGVVQEGVFVNGKIRVASNHPQAFYSTLDDTALPAYLNEPINLPPTLLSPNNNGGAVIPSDGITVQQQNLAFNTYGGFIRDAAGSSDANGFTRSVPRLDPPSLDTDLYNSTDLRYRVLTENSGFWVKLPNGSQFNTGQYGLGSNIYIDNRSDLQKETSVPGVNGGYSLRANWIDPDAVHNYWNGPFYVPPGVEVTLLGNAIRLTRHDGKVFYNPDGSSAGSIITIPLWDYARKQMGLPPLPHDGDDPAARQAAGLPPVGDDPNAYGVNLTLFAEGNIIVHGVYGAITNVQDTAESATTSKLARVHITLVTRGTAYIDGSVVAGDGYVDSNGGIHMEHASTCAILAEDYVCVNTTQFMRTVSANVFSRVNPDLPIFSTPIGVGSESLPYLDMEFNWGVNPSTYTSNGNPVPIFLMVRHAATGPNPALFNLLVNPGLASNLNQALYLFPFFLGFGNSPSPTGALGILPQVPGLPLDDSSLLPRFQQIGLLINGPQSSYPGIFSSNNFFAPQNYPPINAPGYDNLLRVQFDQTAQQLSVSPIPQSDYQLSTAMITPLDVRIEALLYAQNRSFFVIPGYAFNPDANDSRSAYLARNNVRVSYNAQDIADLANSTPSAERASKDVFPFYDEPPDVRITIWGAIAENYAASEGDQAAWMHRWGYIPQYYGSTAYYQNTAARVLVPDDHLFNRDFDDPNAPFEGYDPGQDNTIDYRTPLEQQNANYLQNVTADPALAITNGLRYEYAPILAMPYYRATDLTLANSALLRRQRALRVNIIQTTGADGTSYTFVQTLPPIPDLPVCPNYLYAGENSARIGVDPTDSDNLTSLTAFGS